MTDLSEYIKIIYEEGNRLSAFVVWIFQTLLITTFNFHSYFTAGMCLNSADMACVDCSGDHHGVGAADVSNFEFQFRDSVPQNRPFAKYRQMQQSLQFPPVQEEFCTSSLSSSPKHSNGIVSFFFVYNWTAFDIFLQLVLWLLTIDRDQFEVWNSNGTSIMSVQVCFAKIEFHLFIHWSVAENYSRMVRCSSIASLASHVSSVSNTAPIASFKNSTWKEPKFTKKRQNEMDNAFSINSSYFGKQAFIHKWLTGFVDFNKILIGYRDSPNTKMRHICFSLEFDLLYEKCCLFLESASMFKNVLIIQRNPEYCQKFVDKLQADGFWAFSVNEETPNYKELAKLHDLTRVPSTTMEFLARTAREDLQLFKPPSIIINFDHTLIKVQFLLRYLNYLNVCSTKKNIQIYHMASPRSKFIDNIRKYIIH